MIRFQPSLQIGVIFVFALSVERRQGVVRILCSSPRAGLTLCARLAFASIRPNESDENTKPNTA